MWDDASSTSIYAFCFITFFFFLGLVHEVCYTQLEIFAEGTFGMQAARILLFGYMFYHVYLHYDQVNCDSLRIPTV